MIGNKYNYNTVSRMCVQKDKPTITIFNCKLEYYRCQIKIPFPIQNSCIQHYKPYNYTLIFLKCLSSINTVGNVPH